MKKITIVMYHYVRDLKNSRYPEIKGLDVELFEEQLKYIQEHFNVIRMEDLLEVVTAGDDSKLPERALLLTFDDGYIDHYNVVFPLLMKYGMQGSFFPNAKVMKEHCLLDVNKIHHILATAPINQLVDDCMSELNKYREEGRLIVDGEELPSNKELYKELAVANRWDPAEVIFVKRLLQNRLPEDVRGEISSKLFEKYVGMKEEAFARELYMNLEQAQVMKQNGMYLGLHGYNHYWLGKMNEEQMQEDIAKALDYFSGIVDSDNWVMNYPYGSYSDEVISYIQSKGCKLGVTVEARDAELGVDDIYMLPRWDTNDLPPKGNAKE